MFVRINEALEASKARREENEKGFTLIELLVVVLIIGILSAIAVPIFLGQQQTAMDAAAKSDLATLKIAYVSYAADFNGVYPTTTATQAATVTLLGTYGYKASSNVTGTFIKSSTPASGVFCAQATSASAKIFNITDSTAVASGACP